MRAGVLAHSPARQRVESERAKLRASREVLKKEKHSSVVPLKRREVSSKVQRISSDKTIVKKKNDLLI